MKEILDALVAEMLEQKVRLDEALEEFGALNFEVHLTVHTTDPVLRRFHKSLRRGRIG